MSQINGIIFSVSCVLCEIYIFCTLILRCTCIFNLCRARYAWSSGRTLDFKPLGPGFETQCYQAWGRLILHLIVRSVAHKILAVKNRRLMTESTQHNWTFFVSRVPQTTIKRSTVALKLLIWHKMSSFLYTKLCNQVVFLARGAYSKLPYNYSHFLHQPFPACGLNQCYIELM